jgi:amidophosphoribosyltransferase
MPSIDHDPVEDRPREACGLFGVYGHPAASTLIREGLFSLQHRGQEGAGIAVSDGRRLTAIRGLRLLEEVVAREPFGELAGNRGIGHVRYSTTGTNRPENVQPLLGEAPDGTWAVAHNGNLVNAATLRRTLQEEGSVFSTGTDSEVLLRLLGGARFADRFDCVAGALAKLEGAFSFLIMNERQVMAARDPHGFRPLSVGRLNGAWVFASETCALTQVGACLERDLEPGELLIIDDDAVQSIRFRAAPAQHAHCIFELVYFARPDSHLFGHWVYATRLAHGRFLARECPANADCVAAVPDSGNFAALGFALESGLSLEFAFIRNHYAGRSFLDPSVSGRRRRADRKLSALPDAMSGRRVALVDDSLVRGNTLKRRVTDLKEAGAREVHVRIACPPIAHPCHYGVDYPTREELAAGMRNVEGVRQMIGADSLGYLSMDGLLGPLPIHAGFCRACFTGEYPIARGLSDKNALEPDESASPES